MHGLLWLLYYQVYYGSYIIRIIMALVNIVRINMELIFSELLLLLYHQDYYDYYGSCIIRILARVLLFRITTL
jgi:hypothetical protein